jgi:hypothetical protein
VTRERIPDITEARDTDVRVSRQHSPRPPDHSHDSVSRGGGNDSSGKSPKPPELTHQLTPTSKRDREIRRDEPERTYALRESEVQALADIGRFRTVDVKDLSRFVYAGDESRMNRGIRSLREQGFVEEKTLFRAHKPHRRLLTLTKLGHRVLGKTGALGHGQKSYHGFVKLRELDHDADLYKVYQKAAREIQAKGGKPLRVRLDFELKESINREKERAVGLPEKQRAAWLEAVAEEHGLAVKRKAIHLPDMQIEYETSEGRVERENLELVSENYRRDGIRSKAESGFRFYARGGDTNRIRRALEDTGMVREILSV